jgi:hypothetical protein
MNCPIYVQFARHAVDCCEFCEHRIGKGRQFMKLHASVETYSIYRLAFRVFTAKLNELSLAVSRAAVKAVTSCTDSLQYGT